MSDIRLLGENIEGGVEPITAVDFSKALEDLGERLEDAIEETKQSNAVKVDDLTTSVGFGRTEALATGLAGLVILLLVLFKVGLLGSRKDDG